VNSDSLNVLFILHQHLLHCLKSLLPVPIYHVDFGFFKQSREETLVLDCYFG
jgi:hypothetical protein